jgi:hypothetical protein
MIWKKFDRALIGSECFGMSTQRIKCHGKIVMPLATIWFGRKRAPKLGRSFFKFSRLEQTARAFNASLCTCPFARIVCHE